MLIIEQELPSPIELIYVSHIAIFTKLLMFLINSNYYLLFFNELEEHDKRMDIIDKTLSELDDTCTNCGKCGKSVGNYNDKKNEDDNESF